MNFLSKFGTGTMNALSSAGNIVGNAVGKMTGLDGDIDLNNAFAGMESEAPAEKPTFVEAEEVALSLLANVKNEISPDSLKEHKVIVHPSPKKNNEISDEESDEDLVFEDMNPDFEGFIAEAQKNEISEDEDLVFEDVNSDLDISFSDDDVHFNNESSNLDSFSKELDNEEIIILPQNKEVNTVAKDDSLDDFYSFQNLLGYGAKVVVDVVKDSMLGVASTLYHAPADAINLTKAAISGTENVVNYLNGNASKEEDIENYEPDYSTVDHLYEDVSAKDVLQATGLVVKDNVIDAGVNLAEAAGVDLPALKEKAIDIKEKAIEKAINIKEKADEIVEALREELNEENGPSLLGMVKGLASAVEDEAYEEVVNAPANTYNAIVQAPRDMVAVVQNAYDICIGSKNEEAVDPFAHLGADDQTLAYNDLLVEHLEETSLKDHALDMLQATVEAGAAVVANEKVSEEIAYVGNAVREYIDQPLKELVGEKAGDKINHYLGKAVNVLSSAAYGAERIAGVIDSNNKAEDAQKLYDDYQELVHNSPSFIKGGAQWIEEKVVAKGVKKVLFDRGVPEELIAKNKADLKALTGNDDTHDFLKKAMPLVGLEIRRTLIPLILKKGKAKEVLMNDKENFETLLNIVVPRIVANLAKAAQAASKDPNAPVNLFDIGLFLKDLLLEKFEYLEAQKAKIDKDPNLTPSGREAEIKSILDDIVEDLLKLAFPNGKEDLPVNYIKSPVWNAIVDFVAEEVQKQYTEYKNNPKPKVEVKDDPQLRMLFNEGHKVLCTFAEFMHFHGKEINDRIKKVRAKGKAIEDDPKLQEMFKWLSRAVIENYLSDEEGNLAIPSLFRPFANDLVDSGLLVKPLISMYQDVLAPEASKEAYLLRLREMTSFARVGKPGVAEQIENLSKVFGRKVTAKLVEKFVQPNIDELSDDEKQLQFMWMNYLSEIVETTVLKIFVNYAEQYEGDLSLLPAAMLSDVLSGAHEHFADEDIARKVEEALKIDDPIQRTEALRKAFQPLANDEINRIIKGRLEDILPIPGFAKGFVADMIRKEIVPDLMAEKYVEMSKIVREDGLAKAKLQEVFHSGRPSEACRVMASFVRHMIPAQLVVSDEDLAKAIYNAAKAQLGPNATEKSINTYMLEHGEALKALVAANLRALGDPNNLAMNLTWDVAEPMIEAIIRKGLATISSAVEGIDDPKVMANMVGQIAWAAGHDHLGGLNQLRRDAKVKSFNDLPIDEQFRLFKNLHKSVPNDEEALAAYKKIADNEKLRRTLVRKLDKAKANMAKAKTEKKLALYTAEAEKCRQNLAVVKGVIAENKAIINAKRKSYFVEFGKDMLKLAGFSKASDLPAPAEIQEDLLPLVEDFTADAIMMIVDKIMSPAMLDTFAIKALDILNATDKELAEEMEKIEIPDDLHQRNLDQAMGFLIMEMIQMAPLSGKVLPVDGIKHLLGKKLSENQAAAIGHTVRELLIKHDVSFKMLIEQGITEGLPAITQGKWETDEAGNDVFVPYRWLLNEHGEKILDDQGNPIEVKADKFSFDIPKTKEEAEAAEIQDERNRIANEKALRSKVVETVRTQLHGMVAAQAKALWNSVKGMFEKLILKCFGDHYGTKIHDFLMKICEFTFFKVLGTVLMTLYKPLDKAIWWIVGFYIRHKADQVISAMHSGIHANLAGHIMDIVRDALMNNINPEELEENFLEDMEAREIEEERIATEQAEREATAARAREEQWKKFDDFKQRGVEQGYQFIEAVKAKAATVKAMAEDFLDSDEKKDVKDVKDVNPNQSAELKDFDDILNMQDKQEPIGDNIIILEDKE